MHNQRVKLKQASTETDGQHFNISTDEDIKSMWKLSLAQEFDYPGSFDAINFIKDKKKKKHLYIFFKQ